MVNVYPATLLVSLVQNSLHNVLSVLMALSCCLLHILAKRPALLTSMNHLLMCVLLVIQAV